MNGRNDAMKTCSNVAGFIRKPGGKRQFQLNKTYLYHNIDIVLTLMKVCQCSLTYILLLSTFLLK